MQAKSWGYTKHESSSITITFKRSYLNHLWHFLREFLGTEAFLFCQLAQLHCCLKAFKPDQPLKASRKGLNNQLVFTWKLLFKYFRHNSEHNARASFQKKHLFIALPSLPPAWHGLTMHMIACSLVLTSTNEVNVILIGTFVVHGLKLDQLSQ